MVYLNWRDAGEVVQPRQDDAAAQPADNSRKVSPVGTFFIVLVIFALIGAIGWVVFTQMRARRLGLPAPSWSSYNPFSHSDRSSPCGPPTPATGGIRGWFSDKLGALRGSGGGSGGGGGGGRSSGPGAYERRGFGPLDPDEAWDARVGHEAELGGYGGSGYDQELHNNHSANNYSTPYDGAGGGGLRGFDGHGTPYSGGGYDMNIAAHHDDDDDDDDDDHHRFQQQDRGRTRSRSPAAGPGIGGSRGIGGHNPFDDDAEPSNVSLRGVSPRPIDTSVGGAAAGRKVGGGGGGGHGHGSGSPTSERRSIFRENM